jgi:hypothetical protein
LKPFDPVVWQAVVGTLEELAKKELSGDRSLCSG